MQRRLAITDLAGDMLETSQASWEMLGTRAVIEPPELTLPTVRANIYPELNRQLAYLYRESAADDPYLAYDRSVSASISAAGGEIVELVYNINECQSGATGEDLFKITNKSLLASLVLTCTVAWTAESFSEVVDGLYFLLYEGSGEAKRLLAKLSDEELEILWWVKTLRTGFRHDVDHGDRSKTRKKRVEIGDVYSSLIGRKRPTTRAEWSAAQVALCDHVARFLRDVLDRVDAGS